MTESSGGVPILAEGAETVPAVNPTEKMLPQSHANDLIGQARREGYAKGKEDALMQVQKQPVGQTVPQPGQLQQPTTAQVPQVASPDVRAQVAQELNERAMQEHNTRIANEFVGKLQAAKDRYPDLEKKVTDILSPKLLPILQMANAHENTADVVNDMLENPHKIGNILALIDTPALAMQEMTKLSNSIKANHDAANLVSPKEPLSHLKPSTISSDSGPKTPQDWRRDPRFRG